MIHLRLYVRKIVFLSKSFTVLSILLMLSLSALSQRILIEQIFGVKGYSLFEIGFPLKVIPGERGQFVFLEYWSQGEGEGEQRRITENYYLQGYGLRSFVEHWFVPVTEQGYETMQVKDILGLSKSCVVVGEQFRNELNKICTVARFFDWQGNPRTEEPIIISSYGKSANRKQFTEHYMSSFGDKCLAWMGQNGSRCFMSIWNPVGDSLWMGEMTLDIPKTGYELKDAQVDDEGNIFMLWVQKNPSFTMKDRESAPFILKCSPLSGKSKTYPIEAVGGIPRLVQMKLKANNELIVAGVIADPNSQVGFKNGAAIKGQEVEKWSRLFCYSLDGNDLSTKKEVLQDMPEKLELKYQDEGANFAESRLIVNRNHSILLLEEQYTRKKNLYYLGISCVGFDLDKEELIWTQIIDKRQIYAQSDRFLSYTTGIARERLRIVYLTNMSAMGDLICTSIELSSGRIRHKSLASNEEARYIFFPKRSSMISTLEMVLLGLGNPASNDFKLITVSF